MDAIHEEHGSDWSKQVSGVATTRWLQRDQTSLCKVCGLQDYTIHRYPSRHNRSNGKFVTPKPKPTGTNYGLVLFDAAWWNNILGSTILWLFLSPSTMPLHCISVRVSLFTGLDYWTNLFATKNLLCFVISLTFLLLSRQKVPLDYTVALTSTRHSWQHFSSSLVCDLYV